MKIVRATEKHINEVGRLFDFYRQFYECPPDLALAEQYISDRIKNKESFIFVAMQNDSTASGFVQLYPSFCSVEAIKIMILYDLFVDSSCRKTGVGEALMNQATTFSKEQNATRIDLQTAHTNSPGQGLYEKLGYKKVLEDFYTYSLYINS